MGTRRDEDLKGEIILSRGSSQTHFVFLCYLRFLLFIFPPSPRLKSQISSFKSKLSILSSENLADVIGGLMAE